MEDILRSELEVADKSIIILERTINTYKRLVAAMEQRIELMEENHKTDIKLNYTKNK